MFSREIASSNVSTGLDKQTISVSIPLHLPHSINNYYFLFMLKSEKVIDFFFSCWTKLVQNISGNDSSDECPKNLKDLQSITEYRI